MTWNFGGKNGMFYKEDKTNQAVVCHCTRIVWNEMRYCPECGRRITKDLKSSYYQPYQRRRYQMKTKVNYNFTISKLDDTGISKKESDEIIDAIIKLIESKNMILDGGYE